MESNAGLINKYSMFRTEMFLFCLFFNQITGLCFIYEPHFSQDDKIVVKEFGCSLIEHNEVGYLVFLNLMIIIRIILT